MLTRWKEINEKYNVTFNNGIDDELSETEKKIYNGLFSYEDINFSDASVLISLSNYYMLIKDDEKKVLILNKLAELNNDKGHANLGCHYYNINRNLAIMHFEKASELGNLNAKFNLAKHYFEIQNIEKAVKISEELLCLNYKPAYLLSAQIYGTCGDFNKMINMLEKGIEKEDKNCLISLEIALNNNLQNLKHVLSMLKPNEMITKKLNEINNVIEGNGVMLHLSTNK